MTETFITRDDSGYHTYTGRVLTRDDTIVVIALVESPSHLASVVQLPVADIVCENPVAA